MAIATKGLPDMEKAAFEEFTSTNEVAKKTTVASLLAGEEAAGDKYFSLLRTSEDWQGVVLNGVGTTETLITNGPARIGGVVALSGGTTGTITLRNANATGGGSTGYTFANASDVASAKGMRFDTGITVEFSTGTGNILVLYRDGDFV